MNPIQLKRTLFVSVVVSFLSLFQCTENEIPVSNPGIDPQTGNFVSFDIKYHINKDTILLQSNLINCPVQNNNGLYGEGDRYNYRIFSDTLELTSHFSSKYGFSEVTLLFSRLSGNSLEGSWLFDTCWYEVLHGVNLSDSLQAHLHFLAYKVKQYSWIKIQKDNIMFYADPKITDFSHRLLTTWLIDSTFSDYKVQCDSIDCVTVRLVGKRSNDTIVIKKTSIDEIVFTATNMALSVHTFNKISMCQSDFYPPWFNQLFLEKNKKYPQESPPSDDFEKMTYTYYVKDQNKIKFVSEIYQCIMDTVIKNIQEQQGTYSFDEDSLTLSFEYPGPVTKSYTTSVDLSFSRLSGKQLIGNYLFSSSSYSIIGKADSLDSLQAYSSYLKHKDKRYVWGTINQDTITIYHEHPDLSGFINKSRFDWANMPYSRTCDILFDSISPISFILIGNIANDTVKVEKSYISTTYTYSGSFLSPYTFFEDGRMCPSQVYPVWLKDVFFANNRIK